MHSFPCVLVIPQHSGVSTPKTCCSPHACTATRLHGALPARFHPSVSHGSGRAHARAAPRAQLTTEARDNLKFLATLERYLGILEAGELRAMLDAIPPLLSGLRLARPSTQSEAGCVSGQPHDACHAPESISLLTRVGGRVGRRKCQAFLCRVQGTCYKGASFVRLSCLSLIVFADT